MQIFREKSTEYFLLKKNSKNAKFSGAILRFSLNIWNYFYPKQDQFKFKIWSFFNPN